MFTRALEKRKYVNVMILVLHNSIIGSLVWDPTYSPQMASIFHGSIIVLPVYFMYYYPKALAAPTFERPQANWKKRTENGIFMVQI